MSDAADRRVILIMKQPGNARVLAQAVSELDMHGIGVSSESELTAELARAEPARSALVDVSGFGRDVWRLCELLQEHGVPFVVLSTARERELGNSSIAYGASTVLEKPVAKSALLQLVQNLGSR